MVAVTILWKMNYLDDGKKTVYENITEKLTLMYS